MAVTNSVNIDAQGVVYSSGTGAFSGLDGSTSGKVLTSNGTGVAPSFQTLTANITGPGTSTDRAIATWNGTAGAALYNNSTVLIDSTGRQTNTTQPCFAAYNNATISNVTGDSTVYTAILNTSLVNQGSGYSTSTGLFTAPVAGTYLFNFTFTLTGLLVAHTNAIIQFSKNSNTLISRHTQVNPIAMANSGQVSLSGTTMWVLAANDTMGVTVNVVGGTKVVGLYSDGTASPFNLFSGYLVC